MGIANADGSIVLSTKVDEKGLKSGMRSLKGVMGKMSGLMSAAFSVSLITNFAREVKELYKIQMQNEVKLATVMRQRINATDEQIQQIFDLTAAQQKSGIIGDEVQIAGLQQLATFAKQQETIETLLPAMNNLIAQQNGYEASTGSAVNVANLMGKVLQGQTSALTRVGITFDEAQEKVLKYGNESERAATLAQVITDNVGEMNAALAMTDAGRQIQLANTMGDVKEQFGQVVMQIEILFLPALKALAEILSKIAVVLKTASDALFGGGKQSKPEWQQISTSTKSVKDNIEEQAEAQKELNKETKKTLSAFDELNVLSQDTGGSGADAASSGYDSTVGSAFGGLSGSSVVNEIDETVAKVMGIVGAALVAIGIILICFGQIALGIGFVLAGATAFVASVATLKSNEAYKNTYNQLMKIVGIASALIWIIGVILVCCGLITPLSIGMIIFGAVGIVSVVALNWGVVKVKIKNIFKEIGEWLKYAGMLVLGVMLCVTGVGIPIGIALIAKGAEGIISKGTIYWNMYGDKIKSVFSAILDWVKTHGLLVLGVIFIISGFGIPLGLALIYAGAKGLTQPKDPHWMFFYDKVKEVWGLIKAYWNANIAKYFTASWWGELGRNSINGFIKFIVNGLNKLIEKINSFGFDLPDVLGGGKIGFNISKLDVPHLAKGRVLPPNKPFLAMVGDQKSGTNIETPISEMKRAFREELIQMGGFGGRIEVPVYLGNRQIALAVREGENEMGTETVVGGFANAY